MLVDPDSKNSKPSTKSDLPGFDVADDPVVVSLLLDSGL